jgi:hypothetical protein
MTLTVKHSFVNPIADEPGFTGTKPSDWNANHAVTGSADLTVGSSLVNGGVSTQVLYDNGGVLGEYTDIQLTAVIEIFTNSLSGAVPASGGGTASFLRADGVWSIPAYPNPATPLTSVQYNNSGAFGGDASFFFNNVTKGLHATDVYTGDPTFLIRTSTTLTNNAASQTATMTNGPVLGDPFKWIAIDDNGTTLYIPAWKITTPAPSLDFSQAQDSQYVPILGGLG